MVFEAGSTPPRKKFSYFHPTVGEDNNHNPKIV